MSNKFYSLEVLNGDNAITLGVNNGLSSDYELILPNTPPRNDQTLVYDSGSGLMQWKDLSSGSAVYQMAEPDRIDGLIWFELGNTDGTVYWEFDESNGIWWSNTKTIDLPTPFYMNRNNTVMAEEIRAVNYNQPNVRRNIVLNLSNIYQIPRSHNVNSFYTLTLRFMNNLGVFTDLWNVDTTSWGNPLQVYRMFFDLRGFNNVGNGNVRFLNNVFSYELRVFSDTDTGSARPFGTTRVTYRHERFPHH